MGTAPLRPARAAIAAGAVAFAGLLGCAEAADPAVTSRAAPPVGPELSYLGVKTRLLEGDLVKFEVRMQGEALHEAVTDYAECAAAQYALIRGYGFARHLRTNVYEQAGIWQADAVYTISPALPEGLRTIDAEVVVAHCKDNGIPTV